MNRHRHLMEPELRLPQAASPAPTAETFVMCPGWMMPAVGGEQWLAMQWIYQQAFAEAQAVVKPSVLERDLLGIWN